MTVILIKFVIFWLLLIGAFTAGYYSGKKDA